MKSTSTSIRQMEMGSETQAAKIERFVQAGGVRVRYIEAGAHNPGEPLIMLHGYRTGADYWFPHPLPSLAEEHHVVAPDLPGYGYSGSLPSYGLQAYVEFLGAFLDVLGLTRINLLGHSMGGQVAIAVAARYPERISKLVLVNSAGLPRTEPVWQVPLRLFGDSSVRHWRLMPLIFKLGNRAVATPEGLQMLRSEHISNMLKSVTMPTLIVWGSRDRIVPLEHGALMARHIPHARLAVIRNAGHMPFYQKPHEFNQLVLGFLKPHSIVGETSEAGQGSDA